MRAPQMGMNTELKVEGRALHVQTEDLGPARGLIRSQLFVNGVITETLEQLYVDLEAIPPQPLPSGREVRVMMRAQHNDLITIAQGAPSTRPRAETAEPPPLTSLPPLVSSEPPLASAHAQPPQVETRAFWGSAQPTLAAPLDDVRQREALLAPPPLPYPTLSEGAREALKAARKKES
jgi:hypothetical protein